MEDTVGLRAATSKTCRKDGEVEGFGNVASRWFIPLEGAKAKLDNGEPFRGFFEFIVTEVTGFNSFSSPWSVKPCQDYGRVSNKSQLDCMALLYQLTRDSTWQFSINGHKVTLIDGRLHHWHLLGEFLSWYFHGAACEGKEREEKGKEKHIRISPPK